MDFHTKMNSDDRAAKIIENQLINYNEDNNCYTELGIMVDDLPRLLVRKEFLNLSEDRFLEFNDIFYDDLAIFEDDEDTKKCLMEWYYNKYTHHLGLYDSISDSCVYLSKFQVKPRYLTNGDATKFMIGFKDIATISDLTDLIKYMDQLKLSGRLADNSSINRVIIGIYDYLETFPVIKNLTGIERTAVMRITRIMQEKRIQKT